MKTSSLRHSLSRISTISAACTVISLLPIVSAEEHDKDHSARIIEKSKNLQEQMSKHFHQTWKDICESIEATAQSKISISTASVDVREQHDGYIIRINFPGRDLAKVEITLMNGKSLQIKAPAADKAGRYEQTLELNGLASGAVPQIEKRKKDHLIVVRIPKAVAQEKPSPLPEAKPSPALPPPTDRWDLDVLERMETMRREMDEMFRKSFEDIRRLPKEIDLFDQSHFGSSVDIREESGKYIVRAYLPDRNAESVNVTIEDQRILKIEAVAEKTTTKENGSTMLKHKSNYTQLITLPGPVDAELLKVDRKQGVLTISIPMKTEG